MNRRKWRVGVLGKFDVVKTGDAQIFRNSDTQLTRFEYGARSQIVICAQDRGRPGVRIPYSLYGNILSLNLENETELLSMLKSYFNYVYN